MGRAVTGRSDTPTPFPHTLLYYFEPAFECLSFLVHSNPLIRAWAPTAFISCHTAIAFPALTAGFAYYPQLAWAPIPFISPAASTTHCFPFHSHSLAIYSHTTDESALVTLSFVGMERCINACLGSWELMVSWLNHAVKVHACRPSGWAAILFPGFAIGREGGGGGILFPAFAIRRVLNSQSLQA